MEKNLLWQQFGTKKYIKPYVSVEKIVRQLSTSSALLSSHKSHDHSKIWTLERGLAIGLLGTVPAALLYPCQALDTAMALLIVVHTHFGLEAIIVDYIRPILFGPVAPKIGIALLYVFSVATLAGLLNLIYNDCGLANTIIGVCKK
ncbi:hypothetical protein RUM44_000352 [Polyplax serrata]|uniref:Succinate dehydrogenase [ubiquinone] cytochrome b small subunit n=1 Tax=Polyplax serrata TaxID=468196 RepID=A0ABR1B563_POLSC